MDYSSAPQPQSHHHHKPPQRMVIRREYDDEADIITDESPSTAYPRPPSPYDRRRRDDRRHSRERYRSRSPPPRDYRPRDRSPPLPRGRSRDGDRGGAMRGDRGHDDRDYRRSWRESPPPRERRDYRDDRRRSRSRSPPSNKDWSLRACPAVIVEFIPNHVEERDVRTTTADVFMYYYSSSCSGRFQKLALPRLGRVTSEVPQMRIALSEMKCVNFFLTVEAM